jgi:hypothetical protein
MSCLRTSKGQLLAAECPVRENKIRGTLKVLLRTPAAAPRGIGGGSGRTGTFFLPVHGTVPVKRHAEGR